MESYRGKYFDAYHHIQEHTDTKGEKASVLEDIDFQIELLETDKIDVQYIVNLIKTINLDSKDNTDADREKKSNDYLIMLIVWNLNLKRIYWLLSWMKWFLN